MSKLADGRCFMSAKLLFCAFYINGKNASGILRKGFNRVCIVCTRSYGIIDNYIDTCTDDMKGLQYSLAQLT